MKKRIALVAAAALFGSFFFVLPEGVSADIPTVPAAHVPRSLLDREILDKASKLTGRVTMKKHCPISTNRTAWAT